MYVNMKYIYSTSTFTYTSELRIDLILFLAFATVFAVQTIGDHEVKDLASTRVPVSMI